MRLSLVMPVYNEAATLPTVLQRLGDVRLSVPWELIVVDDGSTDGSADAIDRGWLKDADRVRVVRARRNRGKGAALRHGFALAEGDVLGVQDADLEYDPADIPKVLAPILAGDADVAFGSRQFGSHASYSFWYVVGNRALSLCASALFDRYVTDAYTGSKFFTRDCYRRLRLTADGFDIEAELTAGLLKTGARLFEVPITYRARSREEGKKIRPRDGVRGLGRMLRVRLAG
jgi:glycosyltransferase involved in cell wall biosynthesis